MDQHKVQCETNGALADASDDSGIEHLKAEAKRLRLELDQVLKRLEQALMARADRL